MLLAARAGHADASLRVVSLNIWGLPIVSDAREARMRALGPALAALQPQLVALQEVWAEEDAVLLGAALADAGLKYQERRTSAHLFGNHNAGLLVAYMVVLTHVAGEGADTSNPPREATAAVAHAAK